MNQKVVIAGIVIIAAAVCSILVLKKEPAIEAVAQSESIAFEHLRGKADAPVRIIEYSDFQCPACRAVQPLLDKILQDYPGKVSLVFRHFPLRGHLWSHVVHQAAECAGEQKRFWEYHDRLYQDQQKWSGPDNPTETLIVYARDLGLDLDRFGACLADESIKNRIQAQKETGSELNVKSTPTFFVNGEMMAGGRELLNRGVQLVREELGLPPETVELPAS